MIRSGLLFKVYPYTGVYYFLISCNACKFFIKKNKKYFFFLHVFDLFWLWIIMMIVLHYLVCGFDQFLVTRSLEAILLGVAFCESHPQMIFSFLFVENVGNYIVEITNIFLSFCWIFEFYLFLRNSDESYRPVMICGYDRKSLWTSKGLSSLFVTVLYEMWFYLWFRRR